MSCVLYDPRKLQVNILSVQSSKGLEFSGRLPELLETLHSEIWNDAA